MIIRLYSVLLIAVILLSSCAKEDTQEVGRVIALQLASELTENKQTGIENSTRAADGVNDNATFIFPADFLIAVDDKSYIYTANSANTNMTSSAPANYPVNGNSVLIQAFYPSFKLRHLTTPQTFTVQQNQSQTSTGTAGYMISDLMYGLPKNDFAHLDGSGKVLPTEDPVPLAFEHKMVKIRIDIAPVGVNIKRITMKNVKRSIDFCTVDASFSNLATASDGLGDNVIMYDDATGTSTAFTCTSLIPTQSLVAETPFIDVLIENNPTDQTYTYKLQNNATFSPGKQYIYNISISMTEVEVSCEIAEWHNATSDPEFTQIKTL